MNKYQIIDCAGNVMGVGSTPNKAYADAAKNMGCKVGEVRAQVFNTSRNGYAGDDKTLILEEVK